MELRSDSNVSHILHRGFELRSMVPAPQPSDIEKILPSYNLKADQEG